jgi:AraC-like DNA-binding protein
VPDATTHDPQAPQPPRVITICTAAWPQRDRVAMFREAFGGDRIRVEPSADEPLDIDATLTRVPGLGLLSGRRSALSSHFSDGHDRLIFSLGSAALGKQYGREVVLERGDAIAFSGADPGSLTTSRAGPIATLDFPQGSLVPMLSDARTVCGRRIPSNSPMLQLLWAYLSALRASNGLSASALQPLAVAHIYDLAALTLGAGREAEERAAGRGVRAARLLAIKADLLDNLDREVSLGDVAARHRLSARYVRMLFQSEGTRFTEFVREQRLQRALAKLLSVRFDHLRISDIAYGVGFNDLSYFNRAFRRRFGYSPGESRERRRFRF